MRLHRARPDRSLRGPIADGGAKFLVVFGSVLLLIWGVIAAATSGTENALAGGSSGSGYASVAVQFWVVAITAMTMTFARSRRGKLVCAVGALFTLVGGLALSAAWVFWWLFSGGLVGLGSYLSWKQGTWVPSRLGVCSRVRNPRFTGAAGRCFPRAAQQHSGRTVVALSRLP